MSGKIICYMYIQMNKVINLRISFQGMGIDRYTGYTNMRSAIYFESPSSVLSFSFLTMLGTITRYFLY